MSATLAMKNIRVKAFGTTTTVPNNAIAKLMYYLDCITAVLDIDDSKLNDYQNYDELTGEQLLAVYLLAKLYHPSILIKSGVFILDEKLLYDTNNQFYEITDETIGFHASREIVIGGKTIKVLKCMACNDNWLSKYYFTPIQQIDSLVRRIENENNSYRNYQTQIVTTQTRVIEKPIYVSTEFKSSPVTTTCQFCGNVITTETNSKLNFIACFCCLMFNLLYCCFQICAGKNPCCCDVVHKCPRCGSILGHYDAC